MDIAEGGLNKLIEMYKEALPTVGAGWGSWGWHRGWITRGQEKATRGCEVNPANWPRRPPHPPPTHPTRQLGGYLTDAGDLHHGRLEVLLSQLADLEMATLQVGAWGAWGRVG
jgi:hypothetical protein